MTENPKQNGVLVHKEGEDGAILLDRTNGRILTPNEERPDWAEGLAVGLLQERISFYQQRLGEGQALDNIKNAEAIECSDLGWIGVDAEGAEQETEANMEYRSEVVAKCLGINTEEGTFGENVLAEREVSRENRGRTQQETEALEDSVKTGFGGAEQTQEQQQRAEQGKR